MEPFFILVGLPLSIVCLVVFFKMYARLRDIRDLLKDLVDGGISAPRPAGPAEKDADPNRKYYNP